MRKVEEDCTKSRPDNRPTKDLLPNGRSGGRTGAEVSQQVLDRRAAKGSTSSRTRKFSLRRFLFALLGLAAAGGVGWYGWQRWEVGRFVESTDDAYVGGDVAALAPKVAGFVTAVVADNQAVLEGDLLVKLDDREYRATLARAEGAVAGQVAALSNLDAKRQLQEAAIAGARADIGATEAEAARARFDQDRYRQLAASQAGSIQSFQKADADAKKAVAADQKARAALAVATLQLAVIATERKQTEAALAQATADRDLARLNLGYSEVRAPGPGIVGNRVARMGAYATPGAQLLALVPARGLWVDANFKENQLAQMRIGMPARVIADAVPGRTFKGHVASFAPATGAQFSVIPPENATGNFTKIVQRLPVRILLDGDADALGLLRPGLSVRVEVDERSAAGHDAS